jgi:hypothetical protein
MEEAVTGAATNPALMVRSRAQRGVSNHGHMLSLWSKQKRQVS